MTSDTTIRPFRKMHGLGNDFVIFDGRTDPFKLTWDQARNIADRHRGIGCDQVITMLPSEKADVFMRIQNADGSEVNACGNAARCVGDILLGQDKDKVTIETGAGLLVAYRDSPFITVDMGKPMRFWGNIPLSREMNTNHIDLNVGPLSHAVAVNMGNPHVVFFVDNVHDIPLEELGPKIEHDPLFPERVNVSIVDVRTNHGSTYLRQRVWERGAGITEACGSAACAVMVAASVRGIVDRYATVVLDGGELRMQWDEHDHILMTGRVCRVFEGQVNLDWMSHL